MLKKIRDSLSHHRPSQFPAVEYGGNEFRLLTILPSQKTNRLLCKISVHDRTDVVPYMAVSYANDDDPALEELTLVDRRGKASTVISVARTLHQCLEQIRHAKNEVRIWVDSLCVDFGNVAERNDHARYRRRVFTEARQSLIWLGPAGPKTESTIRDICKLAKRTEHQSWLQIDDKTWDLFDTKAISQLLGKSWFRNVWTRQDLACMPLNESIVTLGHYQFSLVLLEQFIRHYNRFFHVVGCWSEEDQWAACSRWYDPSAQDEGVSWMEWSFRYDESRAQMHPLRDLLFIASNMQARDKRDHVYGVLGMLERNLLGRWDVIVDYQLDVWQAFAQVVKVESQYAGRLMTFELSKTGHPCQTNTLDEFPTWVPDFSKASKQSFETFRLYESIYSAGAASSSKAGLRFDYSKRTVSLSGLVVGIIERMAERPDWMGSLESRYALRKFIRNCESLLEGLPAAQLRYSKSRGYSGAENALWRTLITDAIMVPNSIYGATFERWPRAERGRAFNVSAGHLSDTLFLPKEYEFPRAPDKEPLDVSPAHFDATLRHFSYSHFVTTSEGYMALVPHVAREGDLLCILHGSLTPHVVRHRAATGNYVLLGEAYIHGLMDGQALEEPHYERVFTFE